MLLEEPSTEAGIENTAAASELKLKYVDYGKLRSDRDVQWALY